MAISLAIITWLSSSLGSDPRANEKLLELLAMTFHDLGWLRGIVFFALKCSCFNSAVLFKKQSVIYWRAKSSCQAVQMKMVFCYQNCSDLLWKKIVLVIEKKFEIQGWRPRICKNFEITRTIYSNSERSEELLVTECFFNLFLEVSHI